MNDDTDYDYDFGTKTASGELPLHYVSTYLPYTFHRLNRILKESYGCKLEEIWQGYKANRKQGYKQKYQIITLEEEKVICFCITLDQLRAVFAQMDYPLYDEKSAKTKEQEFIMKHNIKNQRYSLKQDGH